MKIRTREDIRKTAYAASQDEDVLVSRYGRDALEFLRLGMTRQAERRLDLIPQRRRMNTLLATNR